MGLYYNELHVFLCELSAELFMRRLADSEAIAELIWLSDTFGDGSPTDQDRRLVLKILIHLEKLLRSREWAFPDADDQLLRIHVLQNQLRMDILFFEDDDAGDDDEDDL